MGCDLAFLSGLDHVGLWPRAPETTPRISHLQTGATCAPGPAIQDVGIGSTHAHSARDNLGHLSERDHRAGRWLVLNTASASLPARIAGSGSQTARLFSLSQEHCELASSISYKHIV